MNKYTVTITDEISPEVYVEHEFNVFCNDLEQATAAANKIATVYPFIDVVGKSIDLFNPLS